MLHERRPLYPDLVRNYSRLAIGNYAAGQRNQERRDHDRLYGFCFRFELLYGFVSAPEEHRVNPVTFTAPVPTPPTCSLPPGLVNPQAVNDPVVGLTAGDLVLFQNTLPAGTGQAIAEVTNACGRRWCLHRQLSEWRPAAVQPERRRERRSGQQIITGKNTTATRIFVISYYLQLLPDPLGVGPGIPVLMRQVSGHLPVPVAENVVNMQFTYDTYDANGNLLNAVGNAGYPGTSLNLIRKINLTHFTIRSQVSGAQSYMMTDEGLPVL